MFSIKSTSLLREALKKKKPLFDPECYQDFLVDIDSDWYSDGIFLTEKKL